MDQIKEAFQDKQFIVLQGMAGIGKSAVARKFANHHSMQYQNEIWMDMNDVGYIEKREKMFEELCRHMLRKMYANINIGKELEDPCSHLETMFRRLNNEKKKTLFIIDNLDEFLVIEEKGKCGEILPRAIKRLVDMAVQSAKGLIHILGTSRCNADEQFFANTAKNISMAPFTLEESKNYLKSFPPGICENSNILHESSFGFPLILDLFSNILKKIKDERDFKVFLEQIQEKPVETASCSSQHVNNCLYTSLKILGDEEMVLAQTLSVFRGAIFLEHAKNLCSEVGTEFSHIHQLEDKGIIKSTEHGFSMHPFLQEIVNDNVPPPNKVRYKAALTVVYLRSLLKLSKESFDKDKFASMVTEFQDRISSFDHLVSILDSCTSDEKEEYMLQVKTGILKEQDPCSFYLMLRFLHYLVPIDSIKVVFQFLLCASNEENTVSMLQACLDESVWGLSDTQSINEGLHKYESVMFKRRQLSEETNIVCGGKSVPGGDVKVKNLRLQLNGLLKNTKELDNDKIKAYYEMEVYRLLGKLALFVKNFEEATQFFELSSNISFDTFGVNFWTIDSYSYLADSLAAGGEENSAFEWYKKAIEMARDPNLINVPVTPTLLWSYSNFCLSLENFKERAIEPLERILGTKDIVTLEIPDKVLIGLVGKLFKFRLGITGRSIDKEVIQKETMTGIDILKSGIHAVKHRAHNDKGDAKPLEEAMYNWNRNIALYCSHVMLESERRKYAVDALDIAKRNKFGIESEVKYLELIRDSSNDEKDEKMILEVTFLEKTNGIMKLRNLHVEQKEKIDRAMDNCNQNWLKLKLLTCLFDLTSSGYEDTIELMSNIANIYCSEQYPQSKSTYVIYNAVQKMDLGKLSNEGKLDLSNILDKFINKLDEMSSRKDIDMKCKFMIFRITLLQQLDDSNREIKSLMQQVLECGNKWDLSEVKKVDKEYQKYIKEHQKYIKEHQKYIKEHQKYIKEHRNLFYRILSRISDILLYLI